MMPSKRIHPGIGKIFVVGNDNRIVLLSPAIQEIVGTAFKVEFVDMQDLPMRTLIPQPFRGDKWYILIEKERQSWLKHARLLAPHQ